MTRRLVLLIAIAVAFASNSTRAVEPNETFAERTILGSGVLVVTDELVASSGDFPDTMIASLNSAGFVTGFNDDGGTWEGSLGSGLFEVPINNDSSFWFIVTGNPDYDFLGNHDESGNYHVYVDIYNDFGEYEETIEFDDSLVPGEVDQFYLDGFNSFYSYNVEIDNTLGSSSMADVDFFTFTGLTPGASFSAEVTQSTFDGFDSILGWLDDSGTLIDTDDDEGFETLSLLMGTVPGNGQLTFAVSGYGDDDFVGDHQENAQYSLEVTLLSTTQPGDFDQDGDVDGRDFLRWQRKQSPNNGSAQDLQDWQTNYGYNGSLVAAQVVPEPGAIAMLAGMACVSSLSRKRLTIS
jgi:hypothetical protein